MRILLHILFWILIWVWMTTVYIYDEVDFPGYLLFNLIRLPVIMAATYAVIYFVVLRNLVIDHPRYTRGGLLFILIFLSASVFDRMIIGLDINSPTLNGEPLVYSFLNPFAIFKNSFLLLSVLGIAAMVQFASATIHQQKRIHQLEEENLKSELSFLRSQINPHFLFNIFNNLFSLASRRGQEDLAKGLSGMAGVMRYLTYESNVPQVPLSKEIELLQSFIELQRLRIAETEDAIINFNIVGQSMGYQISPVLLLPLLENAFKHSLTPGIPAFIDVRLEINPKKIEFTVKNKMLPKPDLEPGGLGLSNLRSRLEKIYPGKYRLELQKKNDFFVACLSINFQPELKGKK